MTLEEKELRSQAATPTDFFASYHSCYNFTVDACVLAWNAKLPRFWSPAEDGLKQDWSGERVWCNPPYGKGQILPWVRKALAPSNCGVALLLPSRTDTDWFHMLWGAHMIGYVQFDWHRGRRHFVAPPGVKYSSPNERHFVAMVRL